MTKNTLALLALLAATILILGLRFGKVITEPNSYLFSLSEDAVKSYYNFSWYLEYDSGIRHEGINYPYGDHLQYINSHPLYVQILKAADRVVPLSDKGVGILNLTMILSLLAAAPFLYLILRRFALPPWYAALVALIMLLLSPQIDRLGGHFEMAYAFFIPLYWFLLIRWHDSRKKWRWTMLLLLTSLAGGFTSAYYAAFLAIFPLALLLVQVWTQRNDLRGYLPQGLHLLAIAVVPLVLVRGLVSVTDWVDDRPDNPWGFFIFHSNVYSIFLPQRSMLREVLQGWVNMGYQWEGRSYVGYPPTLVVLVALIALLSRLSPLKRPGRQVGRNNGSRQVGRNNGSRQVGRNNGSRLFFLRRSPMNLYLTAAVIVLLFAMCIPFKWLQFLPDLIPPLKQFRCLGRFSWIFYYVFTAYSALLIYKLYRLIRVKGYRIAAFSVVFILLTYWGVEASLSFRNGTKNLFNRNALVTHHGLEVKRALESAGHAPDDFQAIFFLPFANTCGDKLLFTRGMHAFSYAMKCGYQTGIPLIQSFSPRLSFTHAMSSIQLLADSTIYKSRVDDMNDKPVLMVITPEKLNPEEQRMAARADVLWKGEDYSLAKLPVEAFNAGFGSWNRTARSQADSLTFRQGAVRSEVPAEQVLYNGFEKELARETFTGQGALYLRKGVLELFNAPLHETYGSDPVELSFWLYADHRKHNMPRPELWSWDPDGNLLGKEQLESRAVHNVDGLWVRIGHVFRTEAGIRYQLTVRGEFITVDDLLVRPASARVAVFRDQKPVLYDNFRLAADPMQ